MGKWVIYDPSSCYCAFGFLQNNGLLPFAADVKRFFTTTIYHNHAHDLGRRTTALCLCLSVSVSAALLSVLLAAAAV
jgi:hypothetical protein